MKRSAVNKVKLGVFVAVGICLLGVGVYLIGVSSQMFNKNFTLSANFKDVSGLLPGNNVRFAGINVGTVEEILIVNDTQVQVIMIIDQKTQKFIRDDAKAIIGSDGLMGNKVININSGSPGHAQVKDGQHIATLVPLSMEDILQKAKISVENAAMMTDHLAGIFGNIRSGRGTIGKIFMDEELANGLNATMLSVQKGADGFAENMEAAKSSFLLRGYFKKKEKDAEVNEVNDKESKRAIKKAEKQEKKDLKKAEKAAAKDSMILSIAPEIQR